METTDRAESSNSMQTHDRNAILPFSIDYDGITGSTNEDAVAKDIVIRESDFGAMRTNRF